MEEKERYKLESYNEAFCEIHDTELNEWYIRKDLVTNLLNQQDKRIKELEEFNQHLRERIGRQYDKIVALEKSYSVEKEFGDKMWLENKQLKLQLRKKHWLKSQCCDRNYREYTPVISYLVATNTATLLFKNFGE